MLNKFSEREKTVTVHTEQSHYREKSIKRFPSLPLTHFCVCLINSISHSSRCSQNYLNCWIYISRKRGKIVLNNFFILRTFCFIFGRRYFVIYCTVFMYQCDSLCIFYMWDIFLLKKRNTKMAMRRNFQVMLWH
jgi:hypothetical protein